MNFVDSARADVGNAFPDQNFTSDHFLIVIKGGMSQKSHWHGVC